MFSKFKIFIINKFNLLVSYFKFLRNKILPKIIEEIRNFFTARLDLIDDDAQIEDFTGGESRPKTINKANTLYFTIITSVVVFIIWGLIAKIDRSVTAVGRVIPESKIQTIESFISGKLEIIYVEEGDFVTKGQPLFSIDAIEIIADRDRTENTYYLAMAKLARLKAEAGLVEELLFSEELHNNRSDLVEREKQIFLINMSEKEIVERQLAMSQDLFDQGAESEASLLTKKQNLLQRKNAILEELSQTEDLLVDTKASLPGKRIRAEQAVLKSPVNGVLTNINFFTIGSIIEAGQQVAEVVPNDEKLIIETKILPSDAAFVQEGMEAYIALTAYDQSIYGRMRGKVDKISANTRTDNDGNSFYLAFLNANIDEFSEKINGPIQPGMEVQASIIGDKRSVLGYVFSPVTKLKSTAFREK
tara:strand:- start:135 stop:1388 length:1254 start_codon:yes stop_codon:yes gene_type:complete